MVTINKIHCKENHFFSNAANCCCRQLFGNCHCGLFISLSNCRFEQIFCRLLFWAVKVIWGLQVVQVFHVVLVVGLGVPGAPEAVRMVRVVSLDDWHSENTWFTWSKPLRKGEMSGLWYTYVHIICHTDMRSRAVFCLGRIKKYCSLSARISLLLKAQTQ